MNEFTNNPNVTHFNMNNLHIEEISQFTNNFVNYSTNNMHAEMMCFLRVFYIKQLMKLENINKICYLDSDCVLLVSASDIFKKHRRVRLFNN